MEGPVTSRDFFERRKGWHIHPEKEAEGVRYWDFGECNGKCLVGETDVRIWASVEPNEHGVEKVTLWIGDDGAETFPFSLEVIAPLFEGAVWGTN